VAGHQQKLDDLMVNVTKGLNTMFGIDMSAKEVPYPAPFASYFARPQTPLRKAM